MLYSVNRNSENIILSSILTLSKDNILILSIAVEGVLPLISI